MSHHFYHQLVHAHAEHHTTFIISWCMRMLNITPVTSLHYTWHPATNTSTIVTADMVIIVQTTLALADFHFFSIAKST
jgi:hypothetical protein